MIQKIHQFELKSTAGADVLVDFDNRPRRRKVVFHLMGE